MRTDKETAFKLRMGGRSYGEITQALGIPKSTLSGWLSDLVISDEARNRIESRTRKKSIAGLIKRNRNQTKLAQIRAKEIRKEAASEISALSKRELLITGAALYWAEGYKKPIIRNGKEVTHHVVSLTNADPVLVKIFLRFLREYCETPEGKIKVSLRIFPHQNRAMLQEYWQKETKVLPQNFQKISYTISKSSMGKRPFNQLKYGVLQVRVNDTRLYHRIMGYIEGMKKLV